MDLTIHVQLPVEASEEICVLTSVVNSVVGSEVTAAKIIFYWI